LGTVQRSSIYELTDWWAKNTQHFRTKTLVYASRYSFLREFYHRNRKLWYPLYVFHLGLYLLILGMFGFSSVGDC